MRQLLFAALLLLLVTGIAVSSEKAKLLNNDSWVLLESTQVDEATHAQTYAHKESDSYKPTTGIVIASDLTKLMQDRYDADA